MTNHRSPASTPHAEFDSRWWLLPLGVAAATAVLALFTLGLQDETPDASPLAAPVPLSQEFPIGQDLPVPADVAAVAPAPVASLAASRAPAAVEIAGDTLAEEQPPTF